MTADEPDAARPTRRRRRRAGAPQGEPPQGAPVPVPKQAVPKQAAPKQAAPEQAGPDQAAHKRATPKRDAPHKNMSQRPAKAASDVEQPAPHHGRRSRDPSERAMRDLAGTGSSQLSVSAALRARDVNRPTDEDLAAAERDVVIVRRNWHPPR